MRPRLLATVLACFATSALAAGMLAGPARVAAAEPAKTYTPEYTKAGELIAPANYREWIFLTSGYDMTYRERTGVPDHSVFDNVFVNPEAYASFLTTGTWPDKTVMVLENRDARAKGEVLVKGGRFQGVDISGMEIHIKDSSRFSRPGPGGTWGFFNIENGKGKVFEPTASCYTCHRDHAAVDTTFVQFYPTLLGLAEQKGTVSEAYKKDQAAAPAETK